MTDTLQIIDLCKSFKDRIVADSVSLTVAPGEIAGLLGPNGAGKTTVFKMILGLLKPDRGIIRFGNELNDLPMYRRCLMGLGYLPQGPSVFRGLSVQENLTAVLVERRIKNPQKRSDELLKQFNLQSLSKQKASLLSGGERRKLELARALCADPKILLCDEPFAGVDPIATGEIAEYLKMLAKSGIGLLITDHNVRDAMSICDIVHIIACGQIVESGSSEKVIQSNIARRLYLGNTF